MEPESVTRFSQFLQIKSVHPKPDYWGTTKFLTAQAEEMGLESQVVEPVKDKPVVIIKLPGTDPSLKSILLNCHTDVVPVFEDKWTHPPFGGNRVKMEDGSYNIYARGAQDMKVTGSCYLEAFRQIRASGKQTLRNVYAMFVPDEEIGGQEGMGAFVQTEEFKAMNGGFNVDEGLCSPSNDSYLLYSERALCWVKFTAHGQTGHGSQFIENTAIEKLLPIIDEIMKFREEQKSSLKSKYPDSQFLDQGHYTSANLTMLEGGVQANVVPESYTVTFDIRITPDVDCFEFYNWLEKLAKDNGAEIEYIGRGLTNPVTSLDKSDKFIAAMYESFETKNLKPVPMIVAGITDARYVRGAGIPSIGLNPLTNVPMLAHDHDEYVPEAEYLKGIDFYVDLIQRLGNVSE
ncbi:hypothetical protein BB559_006942 [Furculomyces boomerangus]|uniref:Peptidase M20 dimerisation domain-containing protein n=2 Tax=Harpellales TaxID=61421 RepID=A0A2T9XZS6_9FUNG|nr:hypothetical protein BB559_006942 [Furculomyces boomerangus]PWA01270.1 hypothetical protein BB558_002637 [Smittium angustum]